MARAHQSIVHDLQQQLAQLETFAADLTIFSFNALGSSRDAVVRKCCTTDKWERLTHFNKLVSRITYWGLLRAEHLVEVSGKNAEACFER